MGRAVKDIGPFWQAVLCVLLAFLVMRCWSEEGEQKPLEAFETACDNQRYVAVCAAYAKHGAFSVGATLNILLDVLDY